MNKLSMLLLTLAGASLTACNSGAGGSPTTTATATNMVNATESVPMLLDNAGIKASGTIGVVVTAEGNLDYYMDDKFMGVKYHFEDTPHSVDLVSVNPLIIYVTTQAKLGGELKKCTVNASNKLVCATIDRFQDYPVAAKFDEFGNGYAFSRGNISFVNRNSVTKYYHDSAVEVKRTGKFADDEYKGSMTLYDGGFYFPYGDIRKYNFDNNEVSVMDKNSDYNIVAFSLDDSLTGYGTTFSRDLVMIENGKIIPKSLHKFEDFPDSISVAGSSIYVGAEMELKRCIPSGWCQRIDTFNTAVKAISFKGY